MVKIVDWLTIKTLYCSPLKITSPKLFIGLSYLNLFSDYFSFLIIYSFVSKFLNILEVWFSVFLEDSLA